MAILTMFLVSDGTFAQNQNNEKSKTEETQKNESSQAETKSEKDKPAGSKPAETKSADSKSNQSSSAQASADQQPEALLDVKMKDIDGNEVDLKKYQGKVVLVVNVASKCGFTGQYRPLQSLYEKYSSHGFEVIAFPCNQFGKQEPSDEPAINSFCKKKFGIQFALFSKVDVKGEKQAPLFKRLTSVELEPAGKGDIHWNFEKFLIGKDGKPIARFRSNVAPDHEIIVKKIRAALEIEEDAKVDGQKEKPDASKKKIKGKPSSAPSASPPKPDSKKPSKPKQNRANKANKAVNPDNANPEKKSNDS